MTFSGRPTPAWANLGVLGSLAVFLILLAPDLWAQNWWTAALKTAGLVAVCVAVWFWNRLQARD